MSYTMAKLMSAIMRNPDVLVAGIAAGFLLAKFMGSRNQGVGMNSGGGLFG